MVGEVVVVVLELELVEIRLFFPVGEETQGDADRLWLDEEEEEEEEDEEEEWSNRTVKAKLGLSVGRVCKVSSSLALKICMMLGLILLPLTYTPLVLFKSLQKQVLPLAQISKCLRETPELCKIVSLFWLWLRSQFLFSKQFWHRCK